MAKRILAILLSVTMAFGMAACGGKTSNEPAGSGQETSDNTPTETQETANNLNVHIDVEVASLDYQIATDGTSFEVIAAMVEGLYSLDEAGSPILAMAESVEKSDDGLKYTFKLRDANWSNGTPVTADDFVFAWKRLVDPATASEYAFIASIAGIENASAINSGEAELDTLGAVAVDEKTLEVTLDTPVPFFESLMSFPSFYPVNEEFFTNCGDTYGTSPDTIIANGPFKMVSYEPAATAFELEKNDTYWDAAKVELPGLNYKVIKDSQQAMLEYQNGGLDIATLAGEQVEQFQSDPEFQNIMAGYLWYISPNQTVAGLENVNLRKAISMSFDRDAIAQNILKDGSIPANFAVPSELATGPDGKDYRETANTFIGTDKEQAVEYFEKAKQELGKDTFEYTMIVEDTESALNVAAFLQQEIQTNLEGVTVNIEQMPKKNRVERMQQGDFELCLTRWGPDYADPMTYLNMWITESPNNYGFWSNAEYDAIIESAKKGELATDVVARWEALKQAEDIVMAESVILPIYQKGNAVMMKSNVSGIEFHSVAINRVFKNTTKG